MKAIHSDDSSGKVTFLIIIAALGYFVDVYDLLLFLIVKNRSLASIGVPAELITDIGLRLMSWQMAGMLIGGILWGIIGDKKGRLSVLFGSIITYSVANIANGFVQDVESYAVLRFIAGVGLAGELGAGITLVSETMSKEKRGYGTMAVAGIGVLGAVFAYYVGDSFDWRVSFFIGGGMGLVLLLLRASVFESKLFTKMGSHAVRKGDFFMIIRDFERLKRYVKSILIAVPAWFVVGILIAISPEFAKVNGMREALDPGRAVMFTYLGIAFGDLLSGSLSQIFRTRKKIVFIFLTLTYAGILFFLLAKNLSIPEFYALCVYLGVATGYWVIFVTMASEQFGTNLRSTVTTTAPNFVRGSLVLVTLLFDYFRAQYGIINSGLIVGSLTILVAYIALWRLKDTFGKDLDFMEVNTKI